MCLFFLNLCKEFYYLCRFTGSFACGSFIFFSFLLPFECLKNFRHHGLQEIGFPLGWQCQPQTNQPNNWAGRLAPTCELQVDYLVCVAAPEPVNTPLLMLSSTL